MSRAARYVVGIDLGTTHTVVASCALSSPAHSAQVFAIDQLVSASEVAPRALLPSTLYVPLPGELPEAAARVAGADAPYLAGEYAKRRGAETPGRQIASAKSWLCHPGVDRTEAILPWGAHSSEGEGDEATVPPISPVDVSAQYLLHVRRAWDLAHPDAPLAEQDVVLTVPASFDEAARELTLEATRRAGLTVRLLEEPQAAFYDWMARAGDDGLCALVAQRQTSTVLVCDVGGGTTDLSLMRVTLGSDGRPEVTRVAVGDHLLLGGDNMDLALAHTLEPRLAGGSKLSPARFAQLVSACKDAKEKLLGDAPPDEVSVTLLGKGAKLLGSASHTPLSREECARVVLDGFFPQIAADDRPARARSALVSFGLPYERDSAITRHLARFLARHGEAGGPAAPDALVLNGGVFHARAITERLRRVMASWSSVSPVLLPYTDPDLAVARGAVAFGLALRGEGRKIRGGSPRAYFIGVGARDDGHESAVCVIPRGSEEGARHRAPQRLLLVVGRPARFELFASSDDDGHAVGELIDVAANDETIHRLPPLFATLPAEASGEIPVVIEGELTPIGTLDLACAELAAPGADARRFSLAFRLRGTSPSIRLASSSRSGGKRLDEASALLVRVFGKSKEPASAREVKDLVRSLERALGERQSWTTDLSRSLFDTLIPLARARRRSAEHERVFWSLAGYTLRPGFGHPTDADRMAQLGALLTEGITHSREPRVWQQFWIAARRTCGGLDEAAQTSLRDLADPHLDPEQGKRKSKGPKPEALDELLSLATWLERVPAERKAKLGSFIVERMWIDKDNRLREGLGRLGARVPVYASAHYVVSPSVAEGWIEELLRDKWTETPAAPQAAFRLARLTGDRARDVSERLRREVLRRLEAISANPSWTKALQEVLPTSENERVESFGESLPVGLRLAPLT